MRLVNICQKTLLIASLVALAACQKDQIDPFTGQPGNPRFNLRFDNEDNVDLDLYVRDPRGNVISYANPRSFTGGQLDVDCLCGDCPQGPTENIFWPLDNSAPKGIYTYWVQYFGACNNDRASSNYTLTVTYGPDSDIKGEQKGTLSSGFSARWTYELR
jgi:uncharacterized protein YfaP (DUF2135 family)